MMKKTKVTYKNPIKNKTGTVFMKPQMVDFYKTSPSSPYKKVSVFKKK